LESEKLIDIVDCYLLVVDCNERFRLQCHATETWRVFQIRGRPTNPAGV